MYNFVFFSLVSVIISLVKNKLLNIILFGMEHVCSCEVIFGKMVFNLFDRIFVSIL